MTSAVIDPRLEVLRDVAVNYQKLRSSDRQIDWPDLHLIAFKVHSCDLDPDKAGRTLKDCNDRGWQGWVRYRSLACRTDEKPLSAIDEKEAGEPIAGELVSIDQMKSIHLRANSDAPGKLAEWTYEERRLPNGANLAEGEIPGLCEVVVVLDRAALNQPPNEKLQPVLRYHVFWGASDETDPYALRRLCARFTGFGREDRIVRPRKMNQRLGE